MCRRCCSSTARSSGRRYKKILGEDKFEYMAVYEFASEEVFKRFQQSDHLKALIKDYDANFVDHLGAPARGLRPDLAVSHPGACRRDPSLSLLRR